MDSAANNPNSNQIGQGLSEAQIRTAVERSGYPLQTTVAEILYPNFHVQEEWCYVDKDTRELRSIDILAGQSLYPPDPELRVRPQVDLLIECKQSQLPYVFFSSRSSPALIEFPVVAGLRSDIIEITSDDDPSTWSFGVIFALDLSNDPFQREPTYCNTFSKCVRKGADIELSGIDPYIGLVLPLIKGLQHFEVAEQPVQTAWYFDAHLVVGLGVLDAPMIAATTGNSGAALSFVPWVRVLRHEYLEEAKKWKRNRLWAIDVVHKDFLAKYLTAHVLPFAHRFSEKALRHATELATGQGFASGMGADSWDNIESRLKPRSTTARLARTRAIGRNVLRLFLRRGEE